MLRIAVLGCGRIEQMHAANVIRHPRMQWAAVYDVNQQSAERVASAKRATTARNTEEIFSSNKVDAVLIATATPIHADHIEMAAVASKAILSERLIDLNQAQVNTCAAKIAGTSEVSA